MKKLITIILSLTVLFFAALFTACPSDAGETNEPCEYCGQYPCECPEPTVKEDIRLAYELDLNTNRPEATLTFTDYFDPNGAEVTYGFELTGDAVSAELQSNNTRLRVTAGKEGEATIRLDVLVRNEVKASVPAVTFTVIDTTPYKVTFPASSEQAVFTGAATAAQKKDYTFTVMPTAMYVASPPVKVSYTVSGADSKEIEGTLDNAGTQTYKFTIPAAEVVGSITIAGVTGISQNTSPSSTVELLSGGDFEMDGSSTAFTNRDYTFIVTAPAYYRVPSVSYQVGSAEEKKITGVESGKIEDLYVNYTFSVPMADLSADATLRILAIDLPLKITNMPDSFWQANSWADLATGPAGQSKPVWDEDEGTLTFTDTIIRREGTVGGFSDTAGTVTTSWVQCSFMVNTPNTINMLFFTTSGVRVSGNAWGSGDNWLRLFTDASGGIFLTNGQQATNGLAKAGNVTYEVGEWARIDLITTRPAEHTAEVRLFVNGVKAVLQPTTFTLEAVSIRDGNMFVRTGGNPPYPNYGNRSAVWARSATISFQKVEE